MKKPFLTAFILLLWFFANAQPKWQYGLEFNVNRTIRETYQRNIMYSLNGFGIYKGHELYSGFDIIFINWSMRRTWGYEAGYKCHMPLKNRKSNFMIDLNYQFSKYADGCVGAVRYNFLPHDYDYCEAMYRVKSNLLSCGFGYELFYTKWLSSALTVGPGINRAKVGDPRPEVLEMEHRSPSGQVQHHTLFIALIKASIRITL